MAQTGTKRGYRPSKYDTCARCHQKRKAVCKGRNGPTEKLDTLIIDNVKESLLVPERF